MSYLLDSPIYCTYKLKKVVSSLFEVTVLDKVSKNGVPYKALEITFPNGYKKVVYLDKAEQFLVD